MAQHAKIIPSSEFRTELRKRGGETAFRCYQCATCSSVCELAPEGSPFPRRQMASAQWGLVDQLAADPAVWLCHQCNDCTARCPRDAKPGDVMQIVRSLMVENMAAPKFLGKLVGKAGATWPLLIGLPFVFWIVFIHAVNGFAIPTPQEINGAMTIAWHDFVPHWMIYVVYVPVTLWVTIAIGISGKRYWSLMGEGVNRSGSFLSNLIPAVTEILTHKRFSSCDTTKSRKSPHLLFFWGFVGAAITTALIIVAMYGFSYPLPVEQTNFMKIIGNLSGVLLVIGGLWLLFNRMGGGDAVGKSTAFDIFFLFVAVMVGFTGVLTEVSRLAMDPGIAVWIYVSHLSFILCLFATFPYSKFAHMVYRTLAMVHERMTAK
ncbi:MAG: quinone-interacting membrane-bound oxidoreductase complex subunit QmoC [Myxococcota bacterium]|nr:quinone-interacting membrane-bound oxidoreductase complex subunit QmoC [Myxococcota bacterium]